MTIEKENDVIEESEINDLFQSENIESDSLDEEFEIIVRKISKKPKVRGVLAE